MIELMIGDWIRLKDAFLPPLYLKVHSILPPYIQAEGELGQFHNDTLEPILLTPEILEKNGFEEKQLPIGVRKVIWESEDTRTEIVLYMDDTMPMEIRKNIYYEDEICYTLPFAWEVHQLQHALRLCGIDKDIIL